MIQSRHKPNVYIKDEGLNPTGSFKARGLCAAVTMCKAYGLKKIAIPSAGNAASALAAVALGAYAALKGAGKGKVIVVGFDGSVSWSVGPEGASIDKDTALEAVRRDADLQYPLHQPEYFKKLELAGVTDFEGHRCYWLHGTTHWGKDNNQFYDVQTGLLAGYRFQADDSSPAVTVAVFEDYKTFGGPMVATKLTFRTGR